ncbi:hypothetical protein FKW77_001099 [Venturia effusa]|uniref:Uncharacterized protein n=1 Tax=Venturia effusa TaxID=50376 RepID=A0A517L8K9_9PEZI|nr:hypothetical protein FKW77_001099 [Venturia effusa]
MTTTTPPPDDVPTSSPLSPYLEPEELEQRFSDVSEAALDRKVAVAVGEDGVSMRGPGSEYFLGRDENYGGESGGERGVDDVGEGDNEEADGEVEEEESGGEDMLGYGNVETSEVDGGSEGSRQALSRDEDEAEASEEEESSDGSGEVLVHAKPLAFLITPISKGPAIDDTDDDEAGDEDEDMDEVSDTVSSNGEDDDPSFTLPNWSSTRAIRNRYPFEISNGQEIGDSEEDDTPSRSIFTTAPSFTLQTAPATRDPRNTKMGQQPIYFGALGRVTAPAPPSSSPALSEASTIILPSRNPRERVRNTDRSTSPSPAPTTGRLPPSAALSTPATSRTFNHLQAWRYKDVQLPQELPKTMAQWARLEPKVRMITPLPDMQGKGRVSDAFVENIKVRFEELVVKEQKRVLEVVRKSRIVGSYDDDWEFLTGSDKKSQQVSWDNLSNLALRNMKAIIDVIEYEDFEAEVAEANEYRLPSSPSEEHKVVKRDDNYWGMGWSFRGSTGKFEDLTEAEMLAYHRQVHPKSAPLDPKLVLGPMGEDGRREDEDEDEEQTTPPMQLRDNIKGIARRVVGRKPGLLKGGEPGAWSFWVQDEDKHLRDWVLAAQNEA